MDNASLKNLKKLNEDALNYIHQKEIDEELELIAKKLIDY